MFRQIASSVGKMTEIDWNSLFTDFFSMVRVKVACKYASKIPGKMLFEMNNNLYVIQFKVEAMQGDGNLGEEGGDDPRNDEDANIEEFDHDPIPEKNSLGDRRGANSEPKQDPKHGSDPKKGYVSGQKSATWAGLFKMEDENIGMHSGGLDQYSYRKLLKEMEALESDEEDKDMSWAQEDELVRLPEKLCEEIVESSWARKLLDNLYELPEMMKVCQEEDAQGKKEAEEDVGKKKLQRKQAKQAWGLVLAEQRPSRGQRDGRTILEKAQDRKRQTNLEGIKGMARTVNSFASLASEDIVEMASVVGMKLGVNESDKRQAVLDIVETEKERILLLRDVRLVLVRY
jgi:hypothetical protein